MSLFDDEKASQMRLPYAYWPPISPAIRFVRPQPRYPLEMPIPHAHLPVPCIVPQRPPMLLQHNHPSEFPLQPWRMLQKAQQSQARKRREDSHVQAKKQKMEHMNSVRNQLDTQMANFPLIPHVPMINPWQKTANIPPSWPSQNSKAGPTSLPFLNSKNISTRRSWKTSEAVPSSWPSQTSETIPTSRPFPTLGAVLDAGTQSNFNLMLNKEMQPARQIQESSSMISSNIAQESPQWTPKSGNEHHNVFPADVSRGDRKRQHNDERALPTEEELLRKLHIQREFAAKNPQWVAQKCREFAKEQIFSLAKSGWSLEQITVGLKTHGVPAGTTSPPAAANLMEKFTNSDSSGNEDVEQAFKVENEHIDVQALSDVRLMKENTVTDAVDKIHLSIDNSDTEIILSSSNSTVQVSSDRRVQELTPRKQIAQRFFAQHLLASEHCLLQ